MILPQNVVAKALTLFAADDGITEYLGGNVNSVHGLTVDGRNAVLRITPRTMDIPHACITAFAKYLSDNGVSVASPIHSLRGELVESFVVDGTDYSATCYERVQGKHVIGPPSEEWNPGFFMSWGALLGRMHRLSKAYGTVSPCPDWIGEHGRTKRLCPNPVVASAFDRIAEQIDGLPISGISFGLVHNDLHQWNLLLNGDTITAIDFDDTCTNFFVSEIGAAAFHAQWEGQPNDMTKRSFHETFIDAFITGYQKENDLDAAWYQHIPLFMEYRRLKVLIACGHAWRENGNPWQKHWIETWTRQVEGNEPVIPA